MTDDVVEEIAHAVAYRAVVDYQDAKASLEKNPKNTTALKLFNETVLFFQSSWCEELTGMDGRRLMKAADTQAAKRVYKKARHGICDLV